VIPRLGSVLSKMGQELPAASRALVACSGVVADHVLAIVVATAAAVGAAIAALRTDAGRGALAALLAGLPVTRTIVQTLGVAQFCRTFGVLLQAGLTMTHALELAAAAVVSPQMRARIGSVRERILGGSRLTEAVDSIELLPPVALTMVKVGEEAGRLPVTFERLSRLYDREVQQSVKRALSLLEPIVTVLLGIVVGGVAVLVVGTIYSAVRGVGR
jgi:general secretion pathway protein F